MKRLGILFFTTFLMSACADSTEPAGHASLRVDVAVDEAIAAVADDIAIALSGTEATAAVNAEGHAEHVFGNLRGGEYEVSARALSELGIPLASATVTVSVQAGRQAVAHLSLAPGNGLKITGVTFEDGEMRTHAPVAMKISVSQAADTPVSFTFAHDCRCEIVDVEGDIARWLNTWAESCKISITAGSAMGSDTVEIPVTTAYAQGTVLVAAGTHCATLQSGDLSTHAPALVGEDGPAVEAAFAKPFGILARANGDIVFLERDGRRILMIEKATGKLRRLAGRPHENEISSYQDGVVDVDEMSFSLPVRIAEDGTGNLYIADTRDGMRMRKLYASGDTVETIFTGTGYAGHTNGYLAVAVDAHARPYFSTFAEGYLDRFYPNSFTRETVSKPFSRAFDLKFGIDGMLYAADNMKNQILKVDPLTGDSVVHGGTGTQGYSGDDGMAVNAEFNDPRALDIDGKGRMFVVDRLNGAVRRIGPSGRIRTVVGPGLNHVPGQTEPTSAPLSDPDGIAIDKEGNLWISERATCRILKIVGPN